VQARALIEKAERLMETANAEDREDLVDLVEGVRDALANGDEGALDEAMTALTDLVYYLES
jgi:molecular chaperone DnaK